MVFFCVLLFFILFPSFSQARGPCARTKSSSGRCDGHTHGSSLNQLTTSLTVITSEEIHAERQAETVSEVLRDVAGVNVIQTGSMGTATSVFIRGSASNQVLVLVDGAWK